MDQKKTTGLLKIKASKLMYSAQLKKEKLSKTEASCIKSGQIKGL